MPFNVPGSGSPQSHEELLAALNKAMGDGSEAKSKTDPKKWVKALAVLKFVGRILLGTALQGASFWAIGYILAWQNILPFVPEWWHGFALAVALWMFLVITPPTLTLKLR